MTGLCHDGAIAFEDKHERGETFSSVYEIKVGLLKKYLINFSRGFGPPLNLSKIKPTYLDCIDIR